MEALAGVVRDVGWGVSSGLVILLIGGPFVYFQHWGETKQEKAKRLTDDATRAKDAHLGPARRAHKAQEASRQRRLPVA